MQGLLAEEECQLGSVLMSLSYSCMIDSNSMHLAIEWQSSLDAHLNGIADTPVGKAFA